MSGLLEPLIQVFETLVQGALAALLLAYVFSTQRRWKWLFFDFIRRFSQSLEAFLKPERIHVTAAYGAVGLGGVYFLGILMNLISFAVMRPAHERLIHDVLEYVEFHDNLPDSLHSHLGKVDVGLAQLRQQPRVLANLPYESTAFDLAGNVLTGLPKIGSPAVPASHAQADVLCYACYMADEAVWRNHDASSARSALDPLLKQARVARGTSAVGILMASWAIVKVAIYVICLIEVIIARRSVSWARASLTSLGHWLDRRFIRTDEGQFVVQGEDVPLRELRVIEQDARRLVWTNATVAAAAVVAFALAIGAYKMVEREYHLSAAYGYRAAMIEPRVSGTRAVKAAATAPPEGKEGAGD